MPEEQRPPALRTDDDGRAVSLPTPPFAITQPLEVYRQHHQMGLAAFAQALGVSEDTYIALLAGDEGVPVEIHRQVAARLGVRREMVHELVPAPSAEQLARYDAIIAAALARDGVGPGVEVVQPEAGRPPLAHIRLATALLVLDAVHGVAQDADVAALHKRLVRRAREALGLAAGEMFDAAAWAATILEAAPHAPRPDLGVGLRVGAVTEDDMPPRCQG
jgi:DNA-binding XRE family transcriptional regulator